MIAAKLIASDIATSMVVYPTPGQDVEALAARIKAEVPGVSTMTGKDFDKQIGSATSILNSILVGIALISLLVGGLSVVNTMAMSIAERTREIGIKRAIGGSRMRIVREFVLEAGLIGFIGGAGGLDARSDRRHGRQRGRPLVGHGPVPAHDRHGDHGDRLLDDPRRDRRLRPSPPRRPARPGHGAALRVTDMITLMNDAPRPCLLAVPCARRTSWAGTTWCTRSGASTSRSTPARWSRSWVRPGSGKSTLMHILGLLHAPDIDEQEAPVLTFDGRDMVALGDRERTRIRAREMGFVFQDFNLVPTLSALENVMLACEYAGINGRAGAGRGHGRARARRARGPGRPSAVRALWW